MGSDGAIFLEGAEMYTPEYMNSRILDATTGYTVVLA
jgi:hypothetical protein